MQPEGAGTLSVHLRVFEPDKKSFVKFKFLATRLLLFFYVQEHKTIM